MAVSRHYYKLMCTDRKLQYYYKARCYLQEDTSSPEAYQPQNKTLEDESSVEQSTFKQTLKQADCNQFNQVQPYSKPKRDIKSPVELDL